MRPLDWIVLVGTLCSIVTYGLYRSRGSNTVANFLLAGKSMSWPAMGLSIMATQASAITFISTTGQGYLDGMRFVQFYFGMPLAMILICATIVPLFHRTRVFTAYEFLENRFDAKTRALAAFIFLMQRGLSAGLTIYAPALVLSVVMGWPERYTTTIIGALVVFYTMVGGVKAVTWSDVQQMFVIFLGLVIALVTVFVLLPKSVSIGDAAFLAGTAGRLRAVTTDLNWSDQFNIWSGLLGGTFLFLSYFGCDQSQVQRYLTGKSIAQSRLSLLFNAIAKIPMQAFILFIGAMVFVFYIFVPAPVLFQHVELSRIEASAAYSSVSAEYQAAFDQRREAAFALLAARRAGDEQAQAARTADYRAAQAGIDSARLRASKLVEGGSGKTFTDANYVFLSFVTHYLPVGIVGLLIAVVFAAAMSSSAGEINSLATVSVVDFYRRFFKRDATDHHYLWASRLATLFWGAYAVVFAGFAAKLGSLIVAVNQVGSLFYGSLLGCFVLALAFKRVNGTATFISMLVGEAVVLATFFWTSVTWLWYNVIGCAVVVAVGLAITFARNLKNQGAGAEAQPAIPPAR